MRVTPQVFQICHGEKEVGNMCPFLFRTTSVGHVLTSSTMADSADTQVLWRRWSWCLQPVKASQCGGEPECRANRKIGLVRKPNRKPQSSVSQGHPLMPTADNSGFLHYQVWFFIDLIHGEIWYIPPYYKHWWFLLCHHILCTQIFWGVILLGRILGRQHSLLFGRSGWFFGGRCYWSEENRKNRRAFPEINIETSGFYFGAKMRNDEQGLLLMIVYIYA